ncbi:hypothetical protein CSC03_4392 [Enterobacter hormaechei]|nr:hypothetical protein CSC03_4392 [Enterobacter hormaechei]DAV13578.1 MAG TPA: hypothetical protein [Caudoviricetes sp.]
MQVHQEPQAAPALALAHNFWNQNACNFMQDNAFKLSL